LYVNKGVQVVGCSRGSVDYKFDNYRHFCLDVCDEVEVKRLLAEIRNTYNRLDVLINNAGVSAIGYALLTATSAARDMLNTNFVGTFIACRESIKVMQRNRYGRIVNISTIAVPLGTVGTSVYSASKAAIEQFTRVLAKEVVTYGITVNTLALSFTKDSGMVEKIGERAAKEALEQTILKSWIDPEDVVHAMDFFVSERSWAVTGQTLCLGGV